MPDRKHTATRIDALKSMIEEMVRLKRESGELLDRLRRELEQHERDYDYSQRSRHLGPRRRESR